MAKKKDPEIDMRKELRITGDREAPELPLLNRYDYDVDLWVAVQEACWTINEAAHYVHDVVPGHNIDEKTLKMVERTRFWLQKELEKSRCGEVDVNIKMSPGDFMRLLWESRRPVSLKTWALYYVIDTGAIDFRIEAHILHSRYVKAAKIVRNKFPEASIEEIADFLMILPRNVLDKCGLPLFASRSIVTLKDYIKKSELDRLERGRRPGSKKVDLSEGRFELFELIAKEIDN
ncbi:MAG TPA: hypothetical protein PLK94_04710 [Alphaproteobacteria bacterium]|nr:hypothetical protein [Alphaproteobacteria bacterium]HOO50574.1 hypothetical protein [Alphaproteobacteria bacterium]